MSFRNLNPQYPVIETSVLKIRACARFKSHRLHNIFHDNFYFEMILFWSGKE